MVAPEPEGLLYQIYYPEAIMYFLALKWCQEGEGHCRNDDEITTL
jgi:hypothetical protein